MASYDRWFGARGGGRVRSWISGRRSAEQQLLRIMGLFDGPGLVSLIEIVCQPPRIRKVNDALVGIDAGDLSEVITRLRRAELIDRPGGPGDVASDVRGPTLEAHPLVRDYFGEKLKKETLRGWRTAHERLFRRILADTQGWSTSSEAAAKDLMFELFRALDHACEAHLFTEAYERVFATLMCRNSGSKRPFFVTKQLGLHSRTAGFLRRLLHTNRMRVRKSIAAAHHPDIFYTLGHCCRAMGRQRDAEPFMQKALELLEKVGRYAEAASCLGNLCQVNLYLGELDAALALAERCVKLADHHGEPWNRIVARSVRGDALHQLGRFQEALEAFEDAEELFRRAEPGRAMGSFEALRYCDLLLSLGRFEEVLMRLEKLEAASDAVNTTFEERALVLVSIGKAHLGAYKASNDPADAELARVRLDRAIRLFDGAESDYLLPYGLLNRAELGGLLGDLDRAQADVQQCIERSRGEMALHVVDAHIHRVRLQVLNKDDDARAGLAQVGDMVESMNYGRRRGELDEIARELAETKGSPAT